MNTFWHDHLLSFSIRYLMNIRKITDCFKVLVGFQTLSATMQETFDFSFKNINIDIQIGDIYYFIEG